jgi:uncharacterized protein YkwD
VPPQRTLPRTFLLPLLVLAATVRAAPASADPPVGCTNSFELQVVDLVNQQRASFGLAPLALDVRLVEAAQRHSDDMAARNFVSHTGSDGSTAAGRISAAGYVWYAAAENIAAGYATPASVVAGWMGSPGHRSNILNGTYQHIGVGYAYNVAAAYDHYWTQTFGATSQAGVPPLGTCPACSDATDNDDDGLRDFAADPGCGSEFATLENPHCDDGLDNDGDGGVDWDGGPAGGPKDAQCQGVPWRSRETPSSCGLGFEVAPLLAGLLAARRRRGRLAPPAPR